MTAGQNWTGLKTKQLTFIQQLLLPLNPTEKLIYTQPTAQTHTEKSIQRFSHSLFLFLLTALERFTLESHYLCCCKTLS